MSESKKKKPKPKLLHRAVRGTVICDAYSVHFYESARSITVYVWTEETVPKHRKCVVVRLRRADLADWIKRTTVEP